MPAARPLDQLTADRLVSALPGGYPPRNSKLDADTWARAATLFAQSRGHIRLRVLCTECGVSHRTAWRMREALRDSAMILQESGGRPPVPN